MKSGIDLSSWQALLSTLLSLSVVTLVIVGIRLLVMQTIQQRRERQNRQINERLRTLIAAYKVLGGSFTGELAVDPTHLRDLRVQSDHAPTSDPESLAGQPATRTEPMPTASETPGAERRRRVRDAVEAALSDVVLLGTEEQVRLAVKAASDLAAGRAVETAELVVSLRTFIREVLDLVPVPSELVIPKQGPLRPAASGSRRGDRGESGGGKGGAAARGGEGGGGAGLGGSGMCEDADPDGGTGRSVCRLARRADRREQGRLEQMLRCRLRLDEPRSRRLSPAAPTTTKQRKPPCRPCSILSRWAILPCPTASSWPL